MSPRASTLMLAGIWLVLMLLLILTVASAFIPLGFANTLLHLLFASAMAWLVMVVYMQLRSRQATVRFVASTGALWLLLLLVLTLADTLTRSSSKAPW